jgi:hypothetical protein
LKTRTVTPSISTSINPDERPGLRGCLPSGSAGTGAGADVSTAAGTNNGGAASSELVTKGRAIVVLEEGCEEFSNIDGLGQIRFPRGRIAASYEEIRRALRREKLIG